MCGKVQSHRPAPAFAEDAKVPTGAAPCIQDGQRSDTRSAKQGIHLDLGLHRVPMDVDLLVEGPEPLAEPLHGDGQAVAARPRTATASSASAGENPEGIQVSALRRRAFRWEGFRRLMTPKGTPLNSARTSK